MRLLFSLVALKSEFRLFVEYNCFKVLRASLYTSGSSDISFNSSSEISSAKVMFCLSVIVEPVVDFIYTSFAL